MQIFDYKKGTGDQGLGTRVFVRERCVKLSRIMIVSIPHSLKLLLFLVFFLCSLSCKAIEKFEKRELVIEGKAGNVTLMTELAITQAQREQGLMYRKELKDGEGMLFVFQNDQLLSFWMKNTLIPLSIAYISSEGRILEIYDMRPGNLDPVRSSRSVHYALEVPQGWFGRAGLGVGDSIINLKEFLP